MFANDIPVNIQKNKNQYMYIITRDNISINIENKFFSLKKNSSILINYDYSGKIVSDDVLNGGYILFDFNFSENIINFNTPINFKNLMISEYFTLINNAYLNENTHSLNLLITSLLYDSGIIGENSTHSNGLHYNELKNLRDEIYDNPEKKWTINFAADKLHIGKVYFQKIYKNTFGISCGMDIINARIKNAEKLLENTNMTVSEIGFKCGFSGSVQFSRQFKLKTGISPTEYRNKLK